VIAVRVRDDDVLDRDRIEAQLFQAAHNLLFRVIGEERIEDDDAFAGCERPECGSSNDEIEVIENLRRSDIPGFAGRSGPGAASRMRAEISAAQRTNERVPVKSNAAAFWLSPDGHLWRHRLLHGNSAPRRLRSTAGEDEEYFNDGHHAIFIVVSPKSLLNLIANGDERDLDIPLPAIWFTV